MTHPSGLGSLRGLIHQESPENPGRSGGPFRAANRTAYDRLGTAVKHSRTQPRDVVLPDRFAESRSSGGRSARRAFGGNVRGGAVARTSSALNATVAKASNETREEVNIHRLRPITPRTARPSRGGGSVSAWGPSRARDRRRPVLPRAGSPGHRDSSRPLAS